MDTVTDYLEMNEIWEYLANAGVKITDANGRIIVNYTNTIIEWINGTHHVKQ